MPEALPRLSAKGRSRERPLFLSEDRGESPAKVCQLCDSREWELHEREVGFLLRFMRRAVGVLASG